MPGAVLRLSRGPIAALLLAACSSGPPPARPTPERRRVQIVGWADVPVEPAQILDQLSHACRSAH